MEGSGGVSGRSWDDRTQKGGWKPLFDGAASGNIWRIIGRVVEHAVRECRSFTK